MAQNTATSEAPAGWRVERDSMGEMLVPEDALWGAQTERSHENFPIGTERMPGEIVRAFAQLKAAAARANCRLGHMSRTDADLIGTVAPASWTATSHWWCGRRAPARSPI